MANKFLNPNTVVAGSLDVSVWVFMTRADNGQPKTDVAYTDITVTYFRQGGSVSQDVTGSLNALTNIDSAHNDWGWKVQHTTMNPGWYRLDLADAVVAVSSDLFGISISGASIQTYTKEFALHTFTADSSGAVLVQTGTGTGQIDFTSGILDVNIVQCNGSTVAAGAIPNAAAASNGGLPTVNAANGVLLRDGTGTGEIDLTSGGVLVNSINAGAIDSTVLDSTALDAINDALWLSTPASETYAADGVVPNLGQFLLMIMQRQNEFDKSSLTITMKKLDGSTTAATFLLSGTPTDPTGITRTS